MKIIIMLFIAIGFFSVAFPQYNYPLTKTVDSSDNYFGVTYKDPYRWLEYIKEPQAETWFKQQATYTDSILNNLNGRDELLEEWKQLSELRHVSMYESVYENGRLFYEKRMPGENVAKIFYKDGMNGTEKLLFDPTTYNLNKTFAVQRIRPSYDGKKIGIAIAEGGAEIGTLIIMMVDTKQVLKDSISPSLGIGSWAFDDKAFIYNSFKFADLRMSDRKYKLHFLGTDIASDVDLSNYEINSGPNIDSATVEHYFPYFDEGSKNYIFADNSRSGNESVDYFAPIEQFNSKKIKWEQLCAVSDSVIDPIYINDEVYAISHKNAPNHKILETSLKHPDWANAITIAPEKRDQIISSVIHCKDYLLIVYRDGIKNILSKYNFKTKTTSDVKLPHPGSVLVKSIDTKTNNSIIYITSWNKPYTEYHYDAATDAFILDSNNLPTVYPAAYNDLQSEEVEVEGHDGVMIPLSIIYKKGLKKDGSNVCLMEGYGAYGFNLDPRFNIQTNALVVRGVVIAIAHVRGGGEKGDAWHRGGMKTTKPNTWKDFISCAEYLIAKGYTSPQRLACIGASAGGILISRAITERPDLFTAAVCNVGVANAMRGNHSFEEFGTVKDSVECKALFEMDGVQHVVNGTRYPAVMYVGGWNDPRVLVWEGGKFTAALQNASASGKPVLLKVNYNSGHFTDERDVSFSDYANQYAFLLWQCGHPDFQPKK